MVIPTEKELYIKQKTEILQKLETVIDELILRSEEEADGKNKTNLQHHVIKIKVKKARTEVLFNNLKQISNEKWDILRNNMEISLRELRKSFSKAFTMTKNIRNRN